MLADAFTVGMSAAEMALLFLSISAGPLMPFRDSAVGPLNVTVALGTVLSRQSADVVVHSAVWTRRCLSKPLLQTFQESTSRNDISSREHSGTRVGSANTEATRNATSPLVFC